MKQETHWRERAIEKAEGISDGLEVVKAYGARIAEWVLLGCLFANILEMFPLGLPEWVGEGVLAVQAITLDLAGFGLTSMSEHARRQGNHRAATTASRMGWTLISLMMLTVGLVTLAVLLPKTKEFVDGAEKLLILVRVVVTVLYGHVVHSLRQASATYSNDLAKVQEELDRRVQEVDTLRGQVDTAQHQVSTLRHQVDSGQREVSTLQQELDTRVQEVDTLRGQVDSGQAEVDTLRRQIQTALAEVDTLRGQMSEQQDELERVQAVVDSEYHEVSSSCCRVDTQQVSSGQHTVDSGRVSTRREKVSSGQHTVDSGQVIHLDTKKRKGGQDAAETVLGEDIKALLTREPGISDRGVASKLGCSPTTVGKWRKLIEQEAQECVNE